MRQFPAIQQTVVISDTCLLGSMITRQAIVDSRGLEAYDLPFAAKACMINTCSGCVELSVVGSLPSTGL